ncbi:hypothetical protein G6045_13995 [Streptomyces sp. YC504]|uniref:Uncharacterized protein n=1 Tax=Streptomyces mesophilus TaxID=1775132 RepID=A0A6G4XGU4_9ACTN|nr:hypothetical protein [Streptomyces mesophilus]NGO76769.1 hypothetical protein [Streptomyces mesophilus]
MGYAHYTVYRNGEEIEAGYAVESTCEEPNCPTSIDRGMGYLCGDIPGGDEFGCGGYFCGAHLYMPAATSPGNRCARCRDNRAGGRA